MFLLIAVILILMLASMPRWSYSKDWGYGPFGTVLAIAITFFLLRVFGII